MATANQSENPIMLTALHYLFSHKESKIIAHCLDLDLVTSGEDIKQAEERLNTIVLCQIGLCYASGNFSQLQFKAPKEYWDKVARSQQLDRGQLEVEVPPVVLPVERSVARLPVYRSEILAKAA